MDMPKSTKISVENRDKYIEIGLNIAFYRKKAGNGDNYGKSL